MNNIILKYSNDFYNKLYMCYITDNFCDSTIWIYNFILKNKSLEEISIEYLKKINHNDNINKLTCSKLFDAFIKFKKNQQIDKNDALYLSQNTGIISQYELFDTDYKFKIIYLSVENLIREMDGEEFFHWINNSITTNK